MKSIKLIVVFILIAVSGFAQLKVTQDIRYYRNVKFNLSPTLPKAVSDSGVVNLRQMRDSIAAAVQGIGAGTVTSVGSGLGLSGTVTTTGTLSLDTANASVLSRQRAANTYQPKGGYLVTADIVGKLNKADSSGVAAGSYVTGKDFAVGLGTKINTADTVSIGTVLNVDLATDTLATKAYARLVDTVSIGTVLNVDLDTDTLATKAYARLVGEAGETTGTMDSIRVLTTNPETGNIYLNSVDKRIRYKAGTYWYRLSVSDSTVIPTVTLVDSYNESNRDNDGHIYDGGSTIRMQSFDAVTGNLSSVKFYLKKYGAPTGTMKAYLFPHSGTYGSGTIAAVAIAESGTVDVSTLTTSSQLITFTFSGVNKYALNGSLYYFIGVEFAGGDTNNYVMIGNDTSSSTHAGNPANYTNYDGTVHVGTSDLIFYLYKE